MLSEKLKIILAYTLICLIWGSTWMAIRIGLETLTPIFSAGLRFFLASILLYAFIKIRKMEIQYDRQSVILYIILGFFSFVLPFGLVYWGETRIPSWLASVLFAAMPFFVAIFSRMTFRQEKISFDRLAGMILGFSGIIVIFSKNISADLSFSFPGMAAVVGSAILQAAIAVLIKKYGQHLNPLTMNLFPILIAGIFLTLGGLLFEDTAGIEFTLISASTIVYLALFGTIISFTSYYWLLKRINLVILSLSSFITPIVAIVLGALFMNEYLSGNDIFGSSLVLIGILFANFRGLKNYYFRRRAGQNA